MDFIRQIKFNNIQKWLNSKFRPQLPIIAELPLGSYI